MQVIPVLDLMGGHVVLAQGGLRDRYRPIETPLAPSSRAEDVLDGLLRVHPFDTVYIADLDAIQGTGSHDSLLADLARDRPGLRFWVDAGWTAADPVRDWLARHPGTAVLGSESLA